MNDFRPEWLADLGPWHTVGDTPFLARCLPSNPDAAILILRPRGPWAERRWRAVFSPPDRDDDGQDWRHGEIKAPDGHYWPDRESAEAALDTAWSAWRERYRGSQGLAPDDPRRRNLPSAVLARIKALGYVRSETSVGAHVWLVGRAEELHAAAADLQHEIDALRQRVQEHDEAIAEMRLSAVRAALLDETGSAPSITDPPDVWSRETRAALSGAKCLADEAEELRRSEAALLCRPEGGADLGFKVVAGLWWKPLDNGCIEIEDFSRCAHPGSDTFRRAHYHNGEVLAYSFHATPRAAMRAPLT